MWNEEGACSGLSIEAYFRMVVDQYNALNANVRGVWGCVWDGGGGVWGGLLAMSTVL